MSIQSLKGNKTFSGINYQSSDISGLSVSASLQNALTVNGSGELYTALVFNTGASLTGARIKITVDGTVIFDFDATGANGLNGQQNSLNIGAGICMNPIPLFAYNSPLLLGVTASGRASKYPLHADSFNINPQPFPSSTTKAASNTNGFIVAAKKPIIFNSSLVVDVVKGLSAISGIFEYNL